MSTRPSLFIGSSVEGLQIAMALQALLDHACEAEIWSQGVFGLSQGSLESLVLAMDRFDFAVLVLTADDLTIKRGNTQPASRDNVLFELGLFTGGIGRDRTYIVYNRRNPPSLPSDLAGITAASFEPHSTGNLEAALGAASFKIQNHIEKLGLRDRQRLSELSNATQAVQGVGVDMQRLLQLLARSRRNELEIISAQFGPLIDAQKLADMKRDLEAFEETLGQQSSGSSRTEPEG